MGPGTRQIGERGVEPGDRNDEWIQRLTGAEPDRGQAIAELRDLLVRGLTKSLSARYGTGLQAEDVVQDALLKILASLDRFEGRSRFTTWAMAIATRVGISELRRKHYQNVSLDSMTTGDNLTFEFVAADMESADNRIDRRRLLDILQRLVDSELTEKQRVAMQGFLDGLTVEEIARRTGSNRNAVYKLIHDGRNRLRKGFSESGITADDVDVVFA